MKRIIKIYSVSLFLIFILLNFLRANYVINISPSVQTGIYKKEKPINLKKNDLVIFEIPGTAKNIIYGRGYLKKNVKTLLKRIKATENDVVEIKNNELYINKKFIKKRNILDSQNKRLPLLTSKEIQPSKNELFLLGDSKNSFDSLYFGSISKEKILYKANIFIEFKFDKRLMREKFLGDDKK